ncbi:peptidylprolyl isomerase [Bacteroidia bacterium]|nr:peptidylprolyl isomerase [Bacteroidia bacterium]
MAVLETLRKRAGGLLVAVIGIALLSFVAGDLFSGNKGGRGGMFSSNDVGEIDGHGVSYEDYMEKVEHYNEVYRVMYGQQATSEVQTNQIREQAWYDFVKTYALGSVYEQLGVAVSSDELFDLIQGSNPSPLIVQNFSNPQTGEFDRATVLNYLQNLDENPNPEAKFYWLFLEQEIVQQRLQEKMLALVAKSLYTTTLEAQEAVANNAGKVNIQYVEQKISTVSDSLVKVTSSDVKRYYNLYKNKYKQTASSDIDYITLAINASDEDEEAVKTWIEDLAPKFAATEDVRVFASYNSDVAFDETYYKKSELKGELADFAFSKDKTDILSPFKENETYKMARIADIRQLPDSVRARHILLAPRATMDAMRTAADSVKKALQKGANFELLAQQYSTDKAANQKGGDLGWFTLKDMVKPFGDSCFFAKKGKVMVLETRFGIHVVEVTDKGKEEKKVQLAVVEREVVPSKITRAQLFARINNVASAAKNHQTFLDLAQEQGFSSRKAIHIGCNDKSVQELQSARELVRWAWRAKKNEVSPIFEIDNHFVLAVLEQRNKDGFTPVEQLQSEIAATLRQQKKGELLLADFKDADLETLSSQYALPLKTAENITFSSFYIPNIGVEPSLAAAVSSSPQDNIVRTVAGGSGVYAYTVTSTQADETQEAAVAAEKQRMQQMARQRATMEIFEAIQTAAKITDRRGEWVF